MSLLNCMASWLDRREVCQLRERIAVLERAEADRSAHVAYLESRDKLCSSMANIVNKQAFEIASLKGFYDKSNDQTPEGGNAK